MNRELAGISPFFAYSSVPLILCRPHVVSMPPSPKIFLVVDDNADSRFLLVKTLQRKFRDATIHECQESDQALEIAARERLTAIVAHRAADMDGISLIRTLRAANPNVIIL